LSAAWAPTLHLKHSSLLNKNFSDVLWDMKVLAKKTAAASSMCKSTPDTNVAKGPWVKLQNTIAKKPARSYILGSLVKGEKPKLVVEVSENKVFPIHPCY
jgi:hypothetical protein